MYLDRKNSYASMPQILQFYVASSPGIEWYSKKFATVFAMYTCKNYFGTLVQSIRVFPKIVVPPKHPF